LWVHVEHPNYAWLGVWAATTDKPLPDHVELISHHKDEPRPPIATGALNLTVVMPRRVTLQVICADTGKPAAGIRIGAGAGMSAGSSSHGKSDASGRVELKLPPADYYLLADPPRDSPYVRTKDKLHVAKEPAVQTRDLRVQPGCVLILEAIDEDTGKGIPGVTFLSSSQDGNSWSFVQGSTVYVDNPRTDAAGRLRAVVYPGSGRYRINRVDGYDPVDLDSEEVELPAGKTVTVRFKLRKK
jgi:hypothetical protein